MQGTVLVLGATGTVGSLLWDELQKKGLPLRAATRRPEQFAKRLGARGQAVEFDLERPQTFEPALREVEQVFLIARPGDDEADRVALPFIDAMKRTGVRHVVNLTAMGTELRKDFALRKVELYLEDSGLSFTHLRPNWFMQLYCTGPLYAAIRATGAIRVPADSASISYIDARDIASVAAAALTEPQHTDKAYTLTGPEALSHEQVAQAISQVAAKPVRYEPLSEEQARQMLRPTGLSEQRIERLIQFYRLVRQGYCSPVTEDVQAVLGRRARSFDQFAQAHASVWS